MASVKLNDLIKKFPRTYVGEKALYYLGNCYYWINDYNNAEKYFRIFLDKSSKKEVILRKLSYEGLGYAAEQSGRFDQSIEYFKKASEENARPDDSELINLARVYEEFKQNDKAIEIYQRLLKDSPKSDYIGFAKGKIATLKTDTTQK